MPLATVRGGLPNGQPIRSGVVEEEEAKDQMKGISMVSITLNDHICVDDDDQEKPDEIPGPRFFLNSRGGRPAQVNMLLMLMFHAESRLGFQIQPGRMRKREREREKVQTIHHSLGLQSNNRQKKLLLRLMRRLTPS